MPKGLKGAAFVLGGILFVAAIAVFAVLAGDRLPDAVAVFQSGRDVAYLQPTVIDAVTEKPISGAAIIIPGGAEYQTNASGKCPTVSISFSRDTRFDSTLKRPWGDAALIIYADGYLPTVLFDYAVLAGETREGPEIRMISKSASDSDNAICLMEAPNREWVEAFVAQYQPSNNSLSR